MNPPFSEKSFLPIQPNLDIVLESTLLSAEQNPALVYLSSLGKGSRRTMKQALDRIAQLAQVPDSFQMHWEKLRYQHTQAIRTKLMEVYAPATVNKMLSALKGVLKECWKLGKIPAEEYHRAIDLKQIKNQKLPQGRVLHTTEVHTLLTSCSNTPKGKRDQAIFAIMFGCGLRRAEVVKLLFHHYEPLSGELKVISGKGNKDRITYLPQGLKPALDNWIRCRGTRHGPLFCRVQKNNKISFKSLTTQAIYFILKEYASSAGVMDVSPHDSRRTYITTLLDEGVDILTVQKLVGHANVNTTLRYDRREEESKKKAVLKLNFNLNKS